MEILKTILNLVVFLLSICVLVCVHELGHMSMAKLFNVYCYEFSIGMGPAIYQKKPKKGSKQETIFSIRCLPVGGYVSMAGEEDAEQNPEVKVPKERTIEGISHPKKAIVMVAGVVINFIVGYLLFFFDYAFCKQVNPSTNVVTVVKDTKLAEAGLVTGDKIVKIEQNFYIDNTKVGTLVNDINDYYDIQIALSLIKSTSENTYYTEYYPKSEGDYRTVTITAIKNGSETEEQLNSFETFAVKTEGKGDEFTYGTIGVSAYKQYIGIGRAFVEAGKRWAYGCSAIFIALGQAFTPAGATQLGGIIAMFKVSSMATAAGLSTFLQLWGLISVNLAIFNLLPFPGLDGWQLLVTCIEGVSKKKVPSKFKIIATYIGYALLMLLAIVLLFKDIFFPAI